MKNLFKVLFFAFAIVMVACTNVDSKEVGIKKLYGGQVDVKQVYEPGLYMGLGWLWNDMITFNTSQQTLVEKYEFNDKNTMKTGVEIALDYSINPKTVGLFYTKISSPEVKLAKTLKSAAKEVISQYAAAELNLTKRQEAETKLGEILERELPGFYMVFDRVQLTDVDIPQPIADAAEQTAKQAELNKLSESKVFEAKNRLDAARYDAEAKAILSKPEMLRLKELDVEMEYARHGKSRYGENNVFGAGTTVLKNFR